MVLGAWASIVGELVVPRGGYGWVVTATSRVSRRLLNLVAGRRERYEDKDRLLALQGPAILIGGLATWLGALLLGYGLLLSSATGEPLGGGLRLAGSALFTLGFATSNHPGPLALTFLAAASGPTLIAVQIAYLPTIYAAFNRRETLVTLLQFRAGAPAWGPEILIRHQLIGISGSLGELYRRWEEWAANLAESHSTYPVLLTLRSPHPLRSWIVSLLAVLDSAALCLSLCPASAPVEARACLRMGYAALRAVCDTMRIPYPPDPRPDDQIQLTEPEFKAACEMLSQAGFPTERTWEEAWPHFHGWRVNYESTAYALADLLDAPPGPWSGPRRSFPGLVIQPKRPADRRPGAPEG